MTLAQSLKQFVERVEKRAINIRKMLQSRKVLFGEDFDESDPCEYVTFAEIFGSEKGDILTFAQEFLVMYRYDYNTSGKSFENMWIDLKLVSSSISESQYSICVDCKELPVYKNKGNVFVKCFPCMRKYSKSQPHRFDGMCRICESHPKSAQARRSSIYMCKYCRTEDYKFRRKQKNLKMCIDCLKNPIFKEYNRCETCFDEFIQNKLIKRVVSVEGTTKESIIKCPRCLVNDRVMRGNGKLGGYCRQCAKEYQRERVKNPKWPIGLCPRCKEVPKDITSSGHLMCYCKSCHKVMCKEARVRSNARKKLVKEKEKNEGI